MQDCPEIVVLMTLVDEAIDLIYYLTCLNGFINQLSNDVFC